MQRFVVADWVFVSGTLKLRLQAVTLSYSMYHAGLVTVGLKSDLHDQLASFNTLAVLVGLSGL